MSLTKPSRLSCHFSSPVAIDRIFISPVCLIQSSA